MATTYGNIEQLKRAVENRIDELELTEDIAFSEDLDEDVEVVEATENFSVRQAREGRDIDIEDQESCDEFGCVTC